MSGGRRVVVLVAIAALVGAGALIDRWVAPPKPPTATAVSAVQPVAAAVDVLTSTWFCAGPTATPVVTDARLVFLNSGRGPLHATVTYVREKGDRVTVNAVVPARSRLVLRPLDALRAPVLSAVVELDGGQAAVEWLAFGPLGTTVTPCATRASQQWYFADGVTTKDATETLLLLNPFPDDAIVDLSFVTEDGVVAPESLAALEVGGRGMRSIDVGSFVHRRAQVSAIVASRTGRVVASRVQSFDGTGDAKRKGISLAGGAAAPARTWYFPEGLVADGLTESYQLFNPSAREVKAEVQLALEKGDADPIEVTVPAQSRVTVVANKESRIPKAVPQAATVRVTDGPGLVVERTIDAVPPSGRGGVAWTPGALAPAHQWALAAGEADTSVDEWVVVQNPGRTAAHVSLTALANGDDIAVEGLQQVAIGAGGRVALRLGDHLKRRDLSLVVSADQPIVVERDLYVAKRLGTEMTMGIPLDAS